jgi:hypothetical protein
MKLHSSEGDEPEPCPADALHQLEALGLDLHCDFKGTPRIVLPDDPTNTSWPIRSTRVGDWLAAWYFKKTSHALTKWERERILTVLCGQAQAAPTRSPSDAELWLDFEREPVALEVLEFMESRDYERYEAGMSDFLKKLEDRLEKQMLKHRDWPKKPNILSCKLKRLSPGLARAGLLVEIKHKNFGSQVTLTWQRQKQGGDDGEHPPSPASSLDKHNPKNNLPCVDAGDAGQGDSLIHRLRELKARTHANFGNRSSRVEPSEPDPGCGK